MDRHSPKFFSIRHKFIISILLFFSLPIIVLSLTTSLVSEKVLIENIRDDALVNIELIDRQINLMMENMQYALAGFSRYLSGSVPEDISSQLSKIKQETAYQFPYVEDVILMDEGCHILSSSRLDQDALQFFYNSNLSRELTDVFSKKDLNSTAKGAQCQKYNLDTGCVVTKLHTGLQEQENFYGFSVITPVSFSEGKRGYLSFVVNTDMFLDSYQLLQEKKTNDFYLLDYNYQVLSSANSAEISKNFYSISKISSINLSPAFSKVVHYRNSQFVVTTKYSDTLDYILVSLIPYEYIQQVLRGKLSSFVIVVVCCLLFSVLVAFILSQMVYHPVSLLKSTIIGYHQGHRDARCCIKNNDEFGVLAEELNKMLDNTDLLLLQVAREERLRQSYHYQLVQSQINPHFLYNIFELVNSLVRLDMKEEALDTIAKIAKFYRISLSDGINIISVKDEVELLENYLYLQKMRYIELMDFTTQFDPEIFSAKIPKLILQPIAENAIYHGLRNCNRYGKLSFQGYREGDFIVFVCQDNGLGIPPEKLRELNHPHGSENEYTSIEKDFGTSSISYRLYHHFQGNFSLQFESQENLFTRVTLKIPAQQDPLAD